MAPKTKCLGVFFHVFTAYTTLWKISKKGGSSNFAVLMNKNDKKISPAALFTQ